MDTSAAAPLPWFNVESAGLIWDGGDHGWIGHNVQLYEESARVPLLIVGASSGALLPKAGPWMDGVKRLAFGSMRESDR